MIKFFKKPNINLENLAVLIDERIAQNLEISYYDEDHIMLGDEIIECDGPRFHINNTSEIENFSLVKDFIYDPYSQTYCLIGLVDKDGGDILNRNTHYFLARSSAE